MVIQYHCPVIVMLTRLVDNYKVLQFLKLNHECDLSHIITVKELHIGHVASILIMLQSLLIFSENLLFYLYLYCLLD